jgi:hypothetical protein
MCAAFGASWAVRGLVERFVDVCARHVDECAIGVDELSTTDVGAPSAPAPAAMVSNTRAVW